MAEVVGSSPTGSTLTPSADPLRQFDDDPVRAADVAEPIEIFVALYRADERPAQRLQAEDDGVDVVDCEREMAEAGDIRRRARFAGRARRGVKLHQLDPPVTVRRLHHHDVRPDAGEPDDAVDPIALDRHLGLRLEPKLDEERRCGREVVDDNPHVLHA